MSGIADLLDSEPGQHPVPAPQSTVATVATVDPPASVSHARRRSPLVAAALVAVAGMGVAFIAGRASAPERVVSVQAAPPSQAEAWMPDCAATPGDKCQVEAVTRRFIAAWQNGQPVAPFVIAKGAQIPQRVPRGDITRGPQVAVTGSTAIVLWWTASDGMFTATLENYSGEWRVASVAG